MRISVTTYNVKFNNFLFDNEVRSVVGSLESDILCLQEFPLRKLGIWKEELWKLGYRDSLAQKTCETLLGIQQANVIFSKYTLEDRHTVDLTYKDHEPRKAQYCLLDLGDRQVFLLNTHLGLRRQERLFQMGKIIEVLQLHRQEEHMLLVGDFNDWNNAGERMLGGHFLEAHLVLKGRCAKTFPARFPMARLDRIYFRNLRPLYCETLKERDVRKKSDHLALRGVFELPL